MYNKQGGFETRYSIQTGNCYISYNASGKMASLDTKPYDEILTDEVSLFPFQIEYVFRKGNKEYYGDTSCFVFAGIIQEHDARTLCYETDDGILIHVKQAFMCGILLQSAEVINNTGEEVCLKQLYNQCNGIAVDCLNGDFRRMTSIGLLRGEWAGEGVFKWYMPEEVGIIRTTMHKSHITVDFHSESTYTTKNISPFIFVRENSTGKTWFVQHLPDGPYSMEIGLTDREQKQGSFYYIGCGAGSCGKHGFRLYMHDGERYKTCESIYGCEESFTAAIKVLTAFRRKYLKHYSTFPIMFNDYMNCLWGEPNTKESRRLIDSVATLGIDGYCFDNGWYRDRHVHGFTHLGDWIESDERFEDSSLKELIVYIQQHGMIAGLWMEMEVCSIYSDISCMPNDWFLCNEGFRIYRNGRLYFNFGNPNVQDYLFGKIKRLYDMGIRYLKNDYNGTPGCSIDWNGAHGPASVEAHARIVTQFYRKVREMFPDLIVESCSSGGMRADGNFLQNFNVQSMTDCEDYKKLPSVLQGTMIQLLPEQIGVWVCPYPRSYRDRENEEYLTYEYIQDRKDGRETLFNIVTGIMGCFYLSGRIDNADKYNRQIIEKSIVLYRKLRPYIDEGFPIFPSGEETIIDYDYTTFGLKRGDKILLAVWTCRNIQKAMISLGGITDIKKLIFHLTKDLEITSQGIVIRNMESGDAILLEVTVKTDM